jgi:hypothetical protein
MLVTKEDMVAGDSMEQQGLAWLAEAQQVMAEDVLVSMVTDVVI